METCPGCQTTFSTEENFTPPNIVKCPGCGMVALGFSGGFGEVMAALDIILP